jgi:TolB-like protein/DNA-binding winged helix-turn-helix (wHTH) protein
MDRSTVIPLRIGDWRVDPVSSQISRGGETAAIEARTLRLLLCLAEHAGEVVSIDDLLSQAWSGVIVTPDSVYQAVASLRRLLGDDAKQPAYIATVPRLGYRLVAPVSPWVEPAGIEQAGADRSSTRTSVESALADARSRAPDPDPQPISPARNMRAALVAGAALILVLIAAFLLYNHQRANDRQAAATASVPQKSIAVLPFLDLTTQEMNEEYFADGMTEELIDKLSKVPGLHVPAPTASFYFKNKQLTLAEIARSLRVVYVLDGSIRKSDSTLRVAARLVRANDGYVIWSETYERPLNDRSNAQNDIASEITKALRASVH